MKKLIYIAAACMLMFALAGCTTKTSDNQDDSASTEDVATTTMLGQSPDWIAQLPQAEDAEQMFVVAAYDTSTAWISMHQKDDNGTWQMVMTTPGFIGKEGIGKTQEGDALTPVGTFSFDTAFGIAPDPGCAIPYTQVDADMYWSGDQSEGGHYNEMVNIKDDPCLDTADSEHLIEYTRQYQYCLNIAFNKDDIPGGGSGVFLHCLGPSHPYTGGCVAIPEDQMLVVMKNVNPECVVIIGSLDDLCGSMQ